MKQHRLAAEEWYDINVCCPIPGRSYLVASRGVGIVMDVAFFTGPKPGGGLWWTMANIEFQSSAITHWAALIGPETPELG